MPVGSYYDQAVEDPDPSRPLIPIQPATGNNHSAHRVPDAKWIRKNIPIGNVARELGLSGDSRVVDCFREDHPADKRRRSLSIHGKSNTMRCFECDTKSLSNIDLVVQVMGVRVGDAIKWIDAHFPGIPRTELKPNAHEKRHRHQESKTLNPQSLILSPGWPEKSLAQQSVLAAVMHRSPQAGSEQYTLQCSYDKLQLWTGIGSRSTIRAALKGLEERGDIMTWFGKRENRAGFMVNVLTIRILPQAMRSTKSPKSGLRTVDNKKERIGQSPESGLRTDSPESVLLN